VITGYHARLDPTRTGRAFEVIVNVDLAVKDRATVARFEEQVAGYPEVVEFRRMFGLPDYFLRVATADLESFERFVTNQLEDTPGIGRVDSHLTMKTIKYEHVYLHAYATVSEAKAKLVVYIDFYNRRRPHIALGQQTPDAAYFNRQPLAAAA